MPTIEYYMTLSYPIIVRKSTYTDGSSCYEAEHPDLPGCMGQGDSINEAIEDLQHARQLYIESLIEDGLSIPVPSDPLPARFEVNVTTGSISETQTDIDIADTANVGSESSPYLPPELIRWEQLQHSISV